MKKIFIVLAFLVTFLVCGYFLIDYSIDSGYNSWQKKIDESDDCILDTKINDYVHKTKKNASIKKVSVTVYKNGEAGYLLEGNENKDKLFMIGSMTKAFTGLGIMYLENEGKLSLDDDITKFIPDLKSYYNGELAHITINDLLTMKSGFTNSEKLYPSANKDMTLKDWVYSINEKELSSKPGTQYNYSNANYNILGYIIEVVSGTSYEAFMQEKILEPLKLANTFCGQRFLDREVCEGSRLGYGFSIPFHMDVKTGTIPAGYFYSNSKDMGRWIEIWLGKADIPMEYQSLIDKTYVIINEPETGEYFAGWEKFENNVIGHSGGTANYSSRIVFSRKEEAGVCVLTNMNAAATTDNLCNQIYNYFTEGKYDSYVMDIWKIFDIVFGCISLVAILFMIVCAYFKNKILNIAGGIISLVILVTFIIVLPIIFQSGISSILFVWAPWSMLGGMVLLGIGCIESGLMLKKV